MSKYKPYPSYKDSGVEWLGGVPEHWDVRKLGNYGSFTGGSGFPDQYQGNEEGQYPFYKVSDTNLEGNERYLIKSTNYVDLDVAQKLNAKVVKENGIMFPKVGAALLGNKRRIITQPSITDNNTMVFHAHNGDVHYWYYWLSTLDFGKISNPGPVPSVNETQLKLFPSISPPIKEQMAIANFLDQETGKMDLLIEKQQTMIALLKEKRQAVISHAVTKGLNPNVPMKDSGIKWLGQIPENWNIKRLKFNFELQSEKVEIVGQPVIALENIESGSGKFIPTDSNYTGQDVGFKQGDILFGKLRPYLAKVFECRESGVGFGDILVYRPKRHIDSSFGFYSLINDTFIRVVDSSTYGTKMPRASSEFIGEMYLPTPPKSEQKEIASYLDNQTQKIDNLIKKSQQAIELLKERKTALISAAVTGKIDVKAS